jgi:hypothetical protein
MVTIAGLRTNVSTKDFPLGHGVSLREILKLVNITDVSKKPAVSNFRDNM